MQKHGLDVKGVIAAVSLGLPTERHRTIGL